MSQPADSFTTAQKHELVNRITACPSFATSATRQSVIAQLPEAIRNNIPAGALGTTLTDTFSIVDTCLSYPGGLSGLVNAIRFFDAGTIQLTELETYLNTTGFLNPASSGMAGNGQVCGTATITNELLPARNLKFVGREMELAHLHAQLGSNNTVALTALHGMGGVGKTSLALEYVYRHQGEYDLVAWLPAENKLTLELEFIGLLGVLGKMPMPTDTEDNRARAVSAVKQELGRLGGGSKGCLLIFDNAEKPEDILMFRPSGTPSHVIVTSRNRQMGKLGNVVAVDVLSEDDALILLAAYCYPGNSQAGLAGNKTKQLWQSFEEETAAKQLVAELGYLALAIIQAGSYIQATGRHVAGYLTKFKQATIKLFGATDTKPLDYHNTVATTWQVSFDEVERDNPAAAELMSLLAFFAPDKIKLDWFTAVSNKELVQTNLPANLAKLLGDELALDEGLAVLLKYSLVACKDETVSVHRLVQLIMRERLAQKQQTTVSTKEVKPALLNGATYWYNCAVTFLVNSFPNETEYDNLQQGDELIVHLQNLINYYTQFYQTNAEDFSTSPNTTGILSLIQLGDLHARVANYYHFRVFYSIARPLYERAIIIGEKTLGSEHPILASWLNNLAGLLQAIGEYTAARPLYERAIAITEKTLGSDHPDLASKLNNLAGLLQATGEYAAARPLYERDLAITEKALGSNHPSLATWLNNLASLLQATGEYAAARPLFERAIAIGEKALGNEHPELATWLNNLASLFQATGEYAAAKPLFERAIIIGEKTLGSDHPELAIWLNNLASLLQDTGDCQAAKPLFERAIIIGEKTLGSNHPNLATWLNNLASLLQATGEYAAARPLYERAIAIGEKALGNEHPSIAIRLNNLAGLLQATGEYAAARPLYERAITIGEKTLGSDHPDLAISLHNLGLLLYVIGEKTKALEFFRRALTIFEKKLGSNHSYTNQVTQAISQLENQLSASTVVIAAEKIKTANVERLDLANWLHRLAIQFVSKDKYYKAKPLLERVVAIRETILDNTNTQLAISLNNLAFVTLATDENGRVKALSMLKRAFTIFEKNLGSSHPRTMQIAQAISQLEAETEAG